MNSEILDFFILNKENTMMNKQVAFFLVIRDGKLQLISIFQNQITSAETLGWDREGDNFDPSLIKSGKLLLVPKDLYQITLGFKLRVCALYKEYLLTWDYGFDKIYRLSLKSEKNE